VTKLGRLVKAGKIGSIEEIYLHALPIKEAGIVDHLASGLKDEVMKILPVQRQTAAGQRTRFKAFIAVGDANGHLGLGSKVSSEVANAIKGAIAAAKLAVVPIRRGFWGSTVGLPHTVPMKLTGKCGSVRVRLIPAPRGTGLVAAPATKRILTLAGVQDVYTSTTGHSKTMGNFVRACFEALKKSYGFLTPDMWKETALLQSPFAEHTDFLARGDKVEFKKLAPA
jgi:ribosomal protein uS5